MEDILKMLENEPIVKRAFLLLLDETAQDKQENLLKDINKSFEAGEPYPVLEERISKMLQDEYTEELKKSPKDAIKWLEAHFPMDMLGECIGGSEGLDYRAYFLFQYDKYANYIKDVNEETEGWFELLKHYEDFEDKLKARSALRVSLIEMKRKARRRRENLKEALIYRKYKNVTSVKYKLDCKLPENMTKEVLKFAYRLGYTKAEQFEEYEVSGALADYYRTNVLETPNYGNTILVATLQNILRKYYSNDEIVLTFGTQAPKLSKQLKKFGVNPTNDELIAFKEIKQWLSCVSRAIKDNEVILLDMGDFTIPDNVDKWAFQGSCNQSGSCAGNGTAIMLKAMGYNYLKLFRYNLKTEEAKPLARAYFKAKYGELAHAGMYSEGKSYKNRIGSTAYEATSILLATVFKRKLKHFKTINGQALESGSEFSDYYNEDLNYWSNMSGANDYRTIGTASILEEDSYSKWQNIFGGLDITDTTKYDDTTNKFEQRLKELKEKYND